MSQGYVGPCYAKVGRMVGNEIMKLGLGQAIILVLSVDTYERYNTNKFQQMYYKALQSNLQYEIMNVLLLTTSVGKTKHILPTLTYGMLYALIYAYM